jgi:hypothetical protein
MKTIENAVDRARKRVAWLAICHGTYATFKLLLSITRSVGLRLDLSSELPAVANQDSIC